MHCVNCYLVIFFELLGLFEKIVKNPCLSLLYFELLTRITSVFYKSSKLKVVTEI